jgi:hypothetical protein
MINGWGRALRPTRVRLVGRRADGARRRHETRRPRRWHLAGLAALSVLALTGLTCKPAPHGISETSETFEPRGVPWNGVRVYLSSPRHASSGARGECGWEENINGRIFNLYAADLNQVDPLGTLTTRGYRTAVSANSRDDGWRLNRDESNNWGANVHIVTHTNAFVGCENAAQYLLVMFKTGDANSMGLRDRLLAQLDPRVPGGQNSWNCDNLGECAAAAPHIAYIELFFHTNQLAVNWFVGPMGETEAGGAMDASPYLGVALDEHLGSPRAPAGAIEALDRYPGFGQSPDAMLRDETIAYAEAFEREQLVHECMAGAGFDYVPSVAFPTPDMREVADGLGIRAAGLSASGPVASPAASNRTYERGLPAGERERYAQTLLGESAADVAAADRTGEVPAGRSADEFATGGCVGEAAAAVPSIWDAPRRLAAETDALRRDVAGAAAARASADERVATATATADRFVARHAAALEAAADRYDGAVARIGDDRDLAAYLAIQVAAT